MKTTLLTAIIATTCITSMFATPTDSTAVSKDSTLVIIKPKEVRVTDGEGYITIEVYGKEGDDKYSYSIEKEYSNSSSKLKEIQNWDFKIPFLGEKKHKANKPFRPHSNYTMDLRFGFGVVSATGQSNGVDLSFSNGSYEFILDELISVEYHITRKSYIDWGFGLNWRNYRMTGSKRFVKKQNEIILDNYPEGANIDFSRIKIFSLTLSMIYKHKFTKYLGVGVGPIVNFNTGGNIKTRWSVDGVPDKERQYNIHQSPVTLDIKGLVYIRPFSLYFKYSPSNVISKGKGPEFRSMSAGIQMGF